MLDEETRQAKSRFFKIGLIRKTEVLQRQGDAPR
jgi:hypothetical protein